MTIFGLLVGVLKAEMLSPNGKIPLDVEQTNEQGIVSLIAEVEGEIWFGHFDYNMQAGGPILQTTWDWRYVSNIF